MSARLRSRTHPLGPPPALPEAGPKGGIDLSPPPPVLLCDLCGEKNPRLVHSGLLLQEDVGFGCEVEEEDEGGGEEGCEGDHEEEPLKDGAEEVFTEDADAAGHEGGEVEEAKVKEKGEDADEEEEAI